MTRRPEEDDSTALAACRLFRGVPHPDIARLVRGARVRQVAARDTYVKYGGRVLAVPFLLRGSVELSMKRGSVKRIFRIVRSGDSFCEAMAVARAPSPFDAVALEEAHILPIAIDSLEALADRDKTFARAFRRLLAERVIAALGDLDAGTLLSRERLTSYLASVAERAGDGTWRASLPVTKTVLAARLGMKKETLSRVLRSLVDEGAITVDRAEVTILDRARLLARSEAG
ncbi:MAG TPA: Crp/Fnr family transcriptional regulator [Burkholderiales bacterium]